MNDRPQKSYPQDHYGSATNRSSAEGSGTYFDDDSRVQEIADTPIVLFWLCATLVLAAIAWLLFGCKLIALGGEG